MTHTDATALAGPVTLSRELFDFLMGVGEIDGTGFGELNDGLPGAFWWRGLLRAAERETAALHPPAAPEPSNLHKTQIAPAAPATGEVVEMLREARRQLEYLDGRWPTGTTPCIIARIDRALNGGS